MKILIVRTFPDILDPHLYNIQEVGLAKALTRAGHECGIVLYNGKEKDTVENISVGHEVNKANIVIYKLHGYNFLKNGIFPSLNRIVKNYDIIQVHEYDQITSWFYYAWSKKPVIVYHGPYYHAFNRRYNFKCKVFDSTFLKIRQNKKIPCLTKSIAAAQMLKEKGFLDVTPVGVGLDVENLTHITRADALHRGAREPYRLLYVGKIEERRNVFFLLDVFRKLLEKNKKYELTIIGEGQRLYKERFIQEADDLIRKNKLRYIAKMEQRELGKVYQESDIMIFPSNYDIFGMVLLEAMYYNLPVASSVNGGADMLIKDGENGLVIEKFDSTLWAERIHHFLSKSEEYKRIVHNLESEDKYKLTWNGIADKILCKYQECLHKAHY